MVLVPMILSLAVHEYSHAVTAQALGDDTARLQGRVTLNPLSHIDPIGTLVLPLFSIAFNAPFFGWAKPVPYNPLRFRRTVPMRWGTVLVAAAGPLSNLVFALLCTAALGIWYQYSTYDFAQNPGVRLLTITLQVNVVLFFFNMIPIPPLDGSRVLANLLPHRFAPYFEQFERYSFILFIALLVSGGFRFIAYPAVALTRGLLGMAGLPV
jgi:Zn-dependent protease